MYLSFMYLISITTAEFIVQTVILSLGATVWQNNIFVLPPALN